MQGNDKKTSCSTDSLLSGLFHCVRNDKREGRMMPGGESGRSMVEMLGTLAIMGILTIGGIVGFNYAMDKHKANEITDGITMRALSLSPQLLMGYAIQDTSLDGSFPPKIGDYPVALYGDEVGFDLVVSNIDQNVCQHVLETGLRLPSDIYLGEKTLVWSAGQKKTVDFECTETGNEIAFVFNGSLDPDEKTCPVDKPLKFRTMCFACPTEKSVRLASNGCERCPDTFVAGYKGSTGAEMTMNRCASCANPNAVRSTAAACARCDSSATPREMNGEWCVLKQCPEDTFRMNLFSSMASISWSNCISCGAETSYPATSEDCAKCYGERKTVTVRGSTECALTTCPPATFRDPESQDCVKCAGGDSNVKVSMDECARCKDTSNPRNLQYGYCRNCTDFKVISSTAENCALCPGAVYRNGICMKTACAEIGDVGRDRCKTCNDSVSIKTTADECKRCENREMVTSGKNSYCAIKTCDGWFSSDGSCLSCTVGKANTAEDYSSHWGSWKIQAKSAEECTRNCSASRFVSSGGYCCLKDKTQYTEKTPCERCDGTWDTENKKCS